jgi:ATP-dependent Lhr-like helicase
VHPTRNDRRLEQVAAILREDHALARRADLVPCPADPLEAVLGMLAGAYPSDEFAELKARVVWDRVTDIVEGRRDARVVAVTSGGTIPDRGLFGVFLAGEAGTPGRRVGELDEEMVYELRAGMHGDVVVLGASSWRVLDITPDRVIVEPAPGIPGKLPFWKGDSVGRPVELGRAIGEFLREAEGDLARGERGERALTARLRERHDLDELAAANLVAYLGEERETAGGLPTDRRIVVQRFRDELGDWRLVILSPFGGRVHAPLTLAIETRLRERLGIEAQTIWSDDGIAVRLPEGEGDGDARRLAEIESMLFPAAEEVEDLVVEAVGGSALFASRFRENAGRALLLPRRRPGARTPLWQQRQRAADLLQVASRYGSFPILVETYREVMADVFDLDALRELLGGIERREITVHNVETAKASPFASSLLFDYVAAYMYEGDAPLAERRAGALALDRDLLRELLGQEELRELLDPEALADLELSLQGLADDRQADSLEHLHDLLRRVGELSLAEAGARTEGGEAVAAGWLRELAATRRAVQIRVAGDERWIAIEDVARYRDGVGASPPRGVPDAFLGSVTGALEGLLARYARSHGPFLAVDPAARWGLPIGVVEDALARLGAAGTIVRGEFRPNGTEREWCDPEVLRLLRRRSLARLRREVEPVDPETLGRFLPAWQGVAPSGSEPAPLRGSAALERLAEVVDQLAGVPIPASVLERDVLPARIPGYQPRLLDELGAMGEVAWVGRGSLGRDDGRVVLYRPGREPLLPGGPRAGGAADGAGSPGEPLHQAIRDHLVTRGASFFRAIQGAAGRATDAGGRSVAISDRIVLDALWDLVWAGEVTNDTFAPLRALRWKRPQRSGSRGSGGGGGGRLPRPGRLTSLGPPEAAGRWSLVGSALWDASSPLSPTERMHQQALALLDRYGVLVRESVMAEGLEGGFSAVYPILRALEEAGRIRRGYFVAGLGAAQFALAGALDRLRAVREPASATGDDPVVHLLAAADPANPYGAALPWPRRGDDDRRSLQRAAGASVVVVDGAAALYLDRGGTSVQTLPAFDDPATATAAVGALRDLVLDGRVRELVIGKVDGEPVGRSRQSETFLAAGFVQGYRGLVLRKPREGAMIA